MYIGSIYIFHHISGRVLSYQSIWHSQYTVLFFDVYEQYESKVKQYISERQHCREAANMFDDIEHKSVR